jgi:hypothetical protein
MRIAKPVINEEEKKLDLGEGVSSSKSNIPSLAEMCIDTLHSTLES